MLDSIAKEGIKSLYNIEIEKIEFQETRKDFEGDITIVVFPLLKFIKGNPAHIAETLGGYLLEHSDVVEGFNVVKGFLNLVISDKYYISYFNSIADFTNHGTVQQKHF